MSVTIKTLNHGEIDNCGFFGPITKIVRVGEYEIKLEEFCAFATYVLMGGIIGWNGPVPECVQKAVKDIQSVILDEKTVN